MTRVPDLPAGIPVEKKMFLADLVTELRSIPGMVAVVLGGSHAAGNFETLSDLDIGLYYQEQAPFAVADIESLARSISSRGTPTVTDFYAWGPWVNGGAWLHTEVGKVDFLYRNLDQVERTIDEACQGIVRHDYDQQPTFGFYSVIYLAETNVCVPLYDPGHRIQRLKQRVETYPPLLRERVVADALWSAEFTLLFARDYAARVDVYNTSGCLTRVLSNLTQALFAINEIYFLSDKRVMKTIGTLAHPPSGYVERVTMALAHMGATAEELAQSVAVIESVWQDVVVLTGGTYEPRFRLDRDDKSGA